LGRVSRLRLCLDASLTLPFSISISISISTSFFLNYFPYPTDEPPSVELSTTFPPRWWKDENTPRRSTTGLWESSRTSSSVECRRSRRCRVIKVSEQPQHLPFLPSIYLSRRNLSLSRWTEEFRIELSERCRVLVFFSTEGR